MPSPEHFLLHKVLGEVPPQCRLVLERKRLEGWSHRDIAAALAIQEESSERALIRALGRAREVAARVTGQERKAA